MKTGEPVLGGLKVFRRESFYVLIEQFRALLVSSEADS